MARFLDKDGLVYLIERLTEVIERETQINIVADIDKDSTNQQIPGALAVYELVTDMLADVSTLQFEVVVNLPASGEANIIYLTEAESGTYSMNIYSGGRWYELGTTEIDLSGYWAKEDLEALTNTEIQSIIDDVMEG